MNVAIRSKNTALESIMGVALMFFAASFPLTPTQAETGKGEDIFKVIMTIFGVEKSKGDVLAMVTINNGEASKVKFLDTEAFLTPSNITLGPPTTNPAAGSAIIEYVATFPNVTVNAGDEYKACVVPVIDLELTCKTGHNSPAARPEFVDITLNATSTAAGETSEEEEEEGEGEGEE